MKIRIALFLGLGIALAVSGVVLATSKDDIAYPVAELGNCENEQACFAYCDSSENLDECLSFAERHNLLSEQELEKARKFQAVGAVGPGGCSSERECEAYCEDINNIDECLGFAEQHGFMDEEELREAKQVAAALRSGAQLPGGCTGKSSCEAYCSDMSNMRECIAFAEAAGFMSPEELKEAKQVLKALDAGLSLPGNCGGERECDAYCQDPNHAEECVEFALAAGFIPPEEAEEARKMMSLMREGKMPQACREGKEACEEYCSQDQNAQECTTFFVEAGFMSPEEAELFRKTGGKGPGGCKGERECEQFCNNPANQQACFDFATQHGLIPEEELANIEQGIAQVKEMLASAPPEIAQCLREKLGREAVEGIQAGTFLPGPEIGDKMRSCFELQEQIIKNQMRECLAKSCDEFFSCLESLGDPGGPGGGPGGPGGPSPEEEGPGGFDPELQAKIDECVQAQFEQGGPEGFPGEGEFPREGERPFPGAEGFPPEFEGKSREEIERAFREQEEQGIRQEFEQFGPPPGGQEEIPEEFQEQFLHEQEQQRQLEQFEQSAPPTTQFQGGPSPEEIQQFEQQQREQEFQQQFQEQQAPAGGSVLDVFLYFLRPLLQP